MPRSSLRPTNQEITRQLTLVSERLKNDAWVPAYNIFDLLADVTDLGLFGDFDLHSAMRKAVAELSAADYTGQRPPEQSYHDRCKGADLFVFTWDSKSRGCRMYFKFCFFRDQLVIHSFHPANANNRRRRP